MIDLDRHLRRSADAARATATGALDVERDLAATLERARSISGVQIAELPRTRRPTPFAVAIAAVALVALAVGAVLVLREGEPRRHLTVTPATVDATLPPTSAGPEPTIASTTPMPSSSTVPPTAAPSTSEPATTVVESPSDISPGGSVSYLAPPPVLPLRSLGSARLAPRDDENSIDVAIGDTGVVVNQSWSGYVTRIGFDGETRDIPVDAAIGSVVYGPGQVVYGLRQGDAIEDFAMVAVALDGNRAGTTVASTPLGITQYVELPTGAFGHGGAGVVDRVREVNRTVFGYVDVEGQPLVWSETEPVLLSTSSDRTTITDSVGHSWNTAVERAPDGADSLLGPSPPAPSSNGDAVSWTFIGPNARPDQDFGLPTMPVIAALHPDGSVTWWSVPEGWQVLASDVWGTVLGRLTGQKLDLALASFAGEDGPTPAPTGCLGGVSSHDAAHMFTTAMLAARESGSLDSVSTCLPEIPAAFTGSPPACWSECDDTTRTFATDSLAAGEGTNPDGSTFVTASLPVTYRTASGYLDVWETWQMAPTDDGYVISDFAIQDPPFTRERALATITEYFDALAAHDWLAAANLLNGGALEPESRGDLHQLNPDMYTVDGIAAGLARWCQDGCDTAVPTIDELDFDGSFGLTRNGERIQIAWFEGVYSIVGVPFRSTGDTG